MTKKTFTYYDYAPLLSRNGVFNFIVGGRGVGKTYGAKRHVIRKYLKDKSEFIYLRRFRDELRSRKTFFDDIAHEFPEYGFRIHGMEAQMTYEPEDDKPEWHTMGYFLALSQAQNTKSVAYPMVKTIIFDEFILEKGFSRYLPDESAVFNGLYSTVDRWQDKTKVFFIANSVSIMNPYFVAYDISPEREWIMKSDGFIVAHFPDSKMFAQEVKKTRFGQFIAGTEYESFAIHNDFRDNANYLIGKKTPEAIYRFTLITKNDKVAVWSDLTVFPYQYYVTTKESKMPFNVVMDLDLVTDDNYLMQFNDKTLSSIRTAYGRGNVFFESPRLRNTFLRIFKR